jgi:hypothetical protein
VPSDSAAASGATFYKTVRETKLMEPLRNAAVLFVIIEKTPVYAIDCFLSIT